jgi:hypothetical protein
LRAIEHFDKLILRESYMNTLLQTSPLNHYSLVEKAFKDKKELEKSVKSYSNETAMFLGKCLCKSMKREKINNNTASRGDIDMSSGKLLIYHRYGGNLSFLTTMSDTIISIQQELHNDSDCLIFLSGDDLPGNNNTLHYIYILNYY